MHGYSDSLDSSVNIRTNPLNIHMGDGSDLVVGEAGPSQVVSSRKPHITSSPLSLESSSPQKATQLYQSDANVSRHSIQVPVQPLQLGKKKSNLSLEPTAPQELSDLNIPDFSPLVNLDFDNFNLGRQNTIRSQNPMQNGPSKSPALFERIKSIRTHKPDPAADEPLPAYLLQVIQSSPSVEWPQQFKSAPSATNTPNVECSPTFSDVTEEIDLKDSPESGSSFHPVLNSEIEVQAEPTAEPEVEVEELFEPPAPVTPVEVEIAAARQPSVEPVSESADVSVEEPEAVGSPDIADTDPITENDRGRLFMQIGKLESLRGVPIDPTRNPRFTLTLDNGLQTVTTPAVPLPSAKLSGTIHANIGQEFELTVGKELELVLTLNILMDAVQPPSKPRSLGKINKDATAATAATSVPGSPSKSSKSSPKQNRVKSFFSPKRKSKASLSQQVKEQIEAQDEHIQIEREHDAAMQEYRSKRDFWKGLTGKNGEYARGYLFESHYEREIYGVARTYSLPLYNEWQGVDAQHMGDLELKLMFVPRLFGSEQLPSSIANATQLIKQAQIERQFGIEGYLTQNGGDCRMWRRRFMTLNGNELVAHHEATHKVRAVIHMENATQIVDSTDVTPNDNMWCIYEDRSFLLVFHDGEEVSFYADTAAQKQRWVQALTKSMAFSGNKVRSWEDLVIESFQDN